MLESSVTQKLQVLTVGYGNRGFDKFLELIRGHRVTHLVDVRSVPQSAYWEDFRRERLQTLMKSTGITYVYMGDTLGGIEDSPALCRDPDTVELAPLFQSSKLKLGLTKLIEALEVPSRRICLMCGCMRPHRCHRYRLLSPALEDLGVSVIHIDDQGHLKTQDEIAAEAVPQGSLFEAG